MKKQITFLILVLLTACSATPTISKESQLATVVAFTLTAQPAAFTPIPTFTPWPTELPYVGSVYYTFTRAQNVNLRTQPGTLFPVSRVLAKGTRLQILGYAIGSDEWIQVLTDEGVRGWVNLNYVEPLPVGGYDVIAPQDCLVVSGSVTDSRGWTVSGIGFAVEQGNQRTDAITSDNGKFYAYLPKTASGIWRVSYISISSTSNVMTSACLNDSSACGKTLPLSIEVTLPLTEELSFKWQ